MVVERDLFKHQNASINMIKKHHEIPYIFLIGGYGCGKSTTDVYVMIWLYEQYRQTTEPVTIGVLGVTIKLLKQTVIHDFELFCDLGGIPYKDNSQAGTLQVGLITFVYLAMQDPDDIYAHNFHAALVDEIDEVPPERVKKIVTAIQERCRKTMPPFKGQTKGREPFIFFSTTAQGMGGTYQLVEFMKKQKMPHAIIRGRTADNTSLAPSQLRLLKKLYTPLEQEAYLEGKFVNLTTGRVYWAFDRRKHMCMRFPVIPNETIYVGQDFNMGFNASCEMICREGKMYIFNSHHWNDMGQAARQLREMYPTNPIVFIPDASGKEIMQGFIEEFNNANIEICWNSKNPSITERVMAVNKALLWNQLFVMEPLDNEPQSLVDKMILGFETRDFDDNGKPRKGTGPDAVDHGCDSTEYAVWRIIWNLQGFDMILEVLKHMSSQRRAEEREAA